jgi:hypothetical protein
MREQASGFGLHLALRQSIDAEFKTRKLTPDLHTDVSKPVKAV